MRPITTKVAVGAGQSDLAVGMIFAEDVFQAFLNAYGDVGQETLNLLLLHTFCHHMNFLPYACEQNKPHLKRWAAMVLARAIDERSKRQ